MRLSGGVKPQLRPAVGVIYRISTSFMVLLFCRLYELRAEEAAGVCGRGGPPGAGRITLV